MSHSATELPPQGKWSPRMAWLGGVLCALTPFHRAWQLALGEMVWHARVLPGQPAVECAVWLVLLLAGGTLGVRCHGRILNSGPARAAGASFALAGWGAAGLAGWLPPWVFLAWPAMWFGWAVAAGRARRLPDPNNGRKWFTVRDPWNALPFALFVVVATASDTVLLRTMPGGFGAAAGFLAGRFLTWVVIGAALWILIRMHDSHAPRGVRWIGHAMVILLSVLMIADAVLRIVWSKGLLRLWSEMPVHSWAEFLKACEAAGLDPNPLWLAGAIIALGGAVLLFAGGARLSQRLRWSVSLRRLTALAVVAWPLLLASQVSAGWWMSREVRWWEHRACLLHLSPFSPPPGLADFEVEWANPSPAITASNVRDQNETRDVTRPDIFLIVVETFRGDALRPDVTPFLATWRDSECQPMGDTRSASNATHLSWFSILHGRFPIWWGSLEGRTFTAPMLAAAHRAGYRTEVRAAGNFDYLGMLENNFGEPGVPDVLEHTPPGHPEHTLTTPQREVLLMERVRRSVASNSGPVLQIIALDAAHYPYSWHESFSPPFPGAAGPPLIALRPGPADVESMRQRYWNSLAWIDRQIAGFVASLREQGRYDNSLIIVTGDHGEEFYEHGFWFHCTALNREQTHVPLLVKWPAAHGRGPRRELASHLDILPTILDVLGCPESAWAGLHGRPLDRDPAGTLILMSSLVAQNNETMLWLRDGWEAAFSWHRPWRTDAPPHLWLERLTGPAMPPAADSPADTIAALRQHFPDAASAVFSEWPLKEDR